MSFVVLVDASSHLFKPTTLIVHGFVVIIIIFLLDLGFGIPCEDTLILLFVITLLVAQLLYIYFLELFKSAPVEQNVIALVVNVSATNDAHLGPQLALGLSLALFLLLSLALLFDSQNRLLELLVVFGLEVTLCQRLLLGSCLFVKGVLRLLALLIKDVLVLVTELEQSKELAPAADLDVLTYDVQLLRGRDLGEDLTLSAVVNSELKG